MDKMQQYLKTLIQDQRDYQGAASGLLTHFGAPEVAAAETLSCLAAHQ